MARRWYWLTLAVFSLCSLDVFFRAGEPSRGDRDEKWAYAPPKKATLPAVKNSQWLKNPIDAFILAKLEAKGLSPSSPADKSMLLRRVSFDLIGLPPTIAEQEAFLKDSSPGAYEKVVDRLLASPRFGERWAQPWLDLVRYAETDGFKSDGLRPQAHRYRDYVIKAFNDDLPYDRFIQQQLAGDELEPDNVAALTATGMNRLWPDEDNAANLEQRRQEILDDVTDVAGLTFMGLTFGCARCHDHKFDPILQSDYFRLQAFFAPMRVRDDFPAVSGGERKRIEEKRKEWETTTREIRAKMDQMAAGKREEARKHAMEKFRKEIQEAILLPPEKRTPYQQQIAFMAEQQIQKATADVSAKLTGEQKKQFQEMQKQMNAAKPKEIKDISGLMAISDVGPNAPPTHILSGGDWKKPRDEVDPGFPSCFESSERGRVSAPSEQARSKSTTGRRRELAQWLTRKNHPLTARVIVNRLWQQHFGVGIVGTPNDFGIQGEPPTHPELLDWLAVELMTPTSTQSRERQPPDWSLKHIHRLMVTSETYRQTSLIDPNSKEYKLDPENKLLWHARRRRLEGEALRDAILQVSGELNFRMYGTSAKPKLPAGLSSRYAWTPDAKSEDQNRRSIYVLAKRNMRFPMFDAFDQPDLFNSCARRMRTTTSPQALMLLNGEFTKERAEKWAGNLHGESPSDLGTLIGQTYRMAWGRMPTREEIAAASQYIEKNHGNMASFCHAVLNANEFLYVD